MHVVLPNDIDDPGSPSGGNRYDRRVCRGLAEQGWTVREHAVAGEWPRPDDRARAALAGVLAARPDGATVLVDGLVASATPEVLAAQADRLRLVVLVHMPMDDDTEARALTVARAVVATSGWTRDRLLDRYGLPADRVRVAEPGVDPAPPATGSGTGGALLCVAAVTPTKGHDVLAGALAEVADLPWSCVCVGALTRDPGFVADLRSRLSATGLADRVRLAGPCTGDRLDAAYDAADLLVLPSRAETYGMVVTEALARGVPVLGTAVGGLPEALGRAPGGGPPGLLVPPDDPAALAAALRRWLDDADLRGRLGRAARDRRDALTGWSVTASRLATVLAGVAA
ncbi:glycosyltransferase [Micromonospora sp. 15K316]|uniref:glycosyltransferase family 4 protein n=1 Tax=Micromonospora sp. 15K316 TaxID=2530376 RepID=UPI0010438762|nr:glycosyltransferase family 4 protein [Micromonospora sp. 15K316]TDC36833.1 glycosyltransferase [Micromonospora sp. 15K316]